EALRSMERALDLDPASPQVNVDTGWLLYRARKYKEAIAHCERIIAIDPEATEAKATLDICKVLAGETPRDQHIAKLRAFEAKNVQPRSAYNMAVGYAIAGENERAWQWLRRAVYGHELMAPLLFAEPAFAGFNDKLTFPQFR